MRIFAQRQHQCQESKSVTASPSHQAPQIVPAKHSELAPRFCHDFSKVPLHADTHVRKLAQSERVLPRPTYSRRVYAQLPPARTPPVTTPPSGSTLPPPTAQPSLTLSNHTSTSYDDSGGESRKIVNFNVTVPNGLNAREYALVNKIKGIAIQNARGDPFYVIMNQISVPYNFPNWVVDSEDHDPVYASIGGIRWSYTPTANGFHTTDNPGPARRNERNSLYDLCFKTELHRLSSVPANYSSPLPAPLDVKYWQYYVRVDSGGTFSHRRTQGEPDRCA